jgi:hypothetical protein
VEIRHFDVSAERFATMAQSVVEGTPRDLHHPRKSASRKHAPSWWRRIDINALKARLKVPPGAALAFRW